MKNYPLIIVFYKQDTVELLEQEEEQEQGSNSSKEQEEELLLEEQQEQEDEPSNSKEKTIKELLSEIINKLDKPKTQDKSNDNILNDFIKQQDLKNKIVINKLDKLLQAIT